MDDLPDSPSCPDCGSVLVDGAAGLVCRQCGVLVHPMLDVVRPIDDSPGIRGE